jgi:hypothetical protein
MKRVIKHTLTAKTMNWKAARKPCTGVQMVASRRARSSGVYKPTLMTGVVAVFMAKSGWSP